MKYRNNVSVIITTFNRRELLAGAIDSVLAQTTIPDEILVIDDGSADETENLITGFYPQVQYIKQANHGVSKARNAGIRLSKGKWIAFLDDDDTWMPRKIEKQLTALKNTPKHKICFTNEIWIRHGRRVNPKKKHTKYGGDIFDKCLPLCLISPSSVIIQRDVFETYGVFDQRLPACEDYDLWLRLCAFLPVLYLDEALITKYGGHADQLSTRYWGMDRFRIKALENIIKNKQLHPHKKKAAYEMLLQKIEIIITGARNRRKYDMIKIYEEKKEKYVAMFTAD